MRWANFGDSFWYLDALGTKALHGYGALCRQDFIGADYGMTDCSTGTPLPDYWAGLLWSRLMGPTVLAARVESLNSTAIRAYAHCTVGHNGSVTVLLINLSQQATIISLGFPGAGGDGGATAEAASRTEWHLTQSEQAGGLTNATGLLGSQVELNGKIMALLDGEVPQLPRGKVGAGGGVALTGESAAFVVVPAAAAVCASA